MDQYLVCITLIASGYEAVGAVLKCTWVPWRGFVRPTAHNAEVDDMALPRLLALSGEGLALVSKIVVERELQAHNIKFMLRVPGLVKKYYALTVRKRFQNAWLAEIVEAFLVTTQERGRPRREKRRV